MKFNLHIFIKKKLTRIKSNKIAKLPFNPLTPELFGGVGSA